MKEFVVKNIGNIGLITFSAGIWVDVLLKPEEGKRFSVISIILMAAGAVMFTVHIVRRLRERKSAKNSDKEQ
ncbi:MAG: hypothetical protein LBS51_07995 [Oscillospiraceae bacterium]|jgi:predicted permease|nr:hypothetical protein [Oscillospiraceae bacterium]